MKDRSANISGSFGASILIGAYAGVILQTVMTVGSAPLSPSEYWAVPVIILFYGLVAVPFVALGLAIFGLPATELLLPKAQNWWVGIVAIIYGGFAGKLTFYAIDHTLFMGFYDLRGASLQDLGILYGVPTGLAWWAFRRRSITENQVH